MISYRLCAVFLGLKGKLVKLQSESEAMLGKAIVLSGSTRSPVKSSELSELWEKSIGKKSHCNFALRSTGNNGKEFRRILKSRTSLH